MIEQLIAGARQGVEARRSELPQADLESRLSARTEDRPFNEALVRPGLSLIAEFKRRSPSAGEIAAGADVAERVSAYERGGAAALSVLTDERHFGGSLQDLKEARAACGMPIIRKDFIVEPYQLYEAAVWGADAVLLIVRALDDEQLGALYEEARRIDLDCLVEVHDAEELERALEIDAEVIGINNRDLDEQRVDIATTFELMPDVPAGKTVVAESGISGRAELEELDRVVVDAELIGGALMTAAVVSKSSDEGDTNVVNQIYKADGDGVAFIESQIPATESQAFSPFGEPESEGGGTATGSGFVIDGEGHVLTNNHVVEGADKIEVKLGASDTEYTAEVVGADPASDLALLKVEAPAKELHPLTLGNSSEVEVGDPVVAIGNPFGLDRTVTSGIVSALQRQIQAPNGFSIDNVIQTDAAINPGNSGGPLINGEGEVIGINSQIETGGSGSEGNVGIGFSIPINTAKAEIQQLETKGEVEHAYLGIEGGSITPELAKALNLPVDEGVIVQSVEKGGPADKAGLEGGTTSATIDGAEVTLGGDIITEIDGKKVAAMEELIEIVNDGKPGESIELSILRDGQHKTANVTLGKRPASVEGSSSTPPGE